MSMMKVVPSVATLILVLAGSARASAQETQDTMRLAPELRTARAAVAAAYAKLDGTAAIKYFTDAAVVDFGGQIHNGRSAIAGWFAEAFSGLTELRSRNASFVIGDGEVTERAGYTAVTTDGQEQPGSSETVWRRQQDGSWKVVRLSVM